MEQPDPAARRFWLMQFARLGGAALALVGALSLAGRIDQPYPIGVALLMLGMAGFFAVPALLAKKWRSGE